MKAASIHHLRDDIAVVGWACRLPGANSVDQLWSLLLEERCAVSRVPPDRFSLARFGHPRKQEPGKSYTWAAGILDDIWGFDPAVFGISPREAVQIEPQQRILLQLTWEALEDAGIRPSSIANSDVGVFIGASQTDYGHAFFDDQAIADAHFATGTAVAILANRISYVYGLRGPSITIDTACSSSLVALHQAMEALQSGKIDTAIVGGSNLIASPASFIAFSQANMLSPTGLCQAFSAKADGFVRAEGAVVLVLRKAAHAHAKQNPIHGLVLASDVNSDGRTNGISLPSIDAQESLIGRIYARNDIDLNRLAFIEAHGTGTPVGDPVEAGAIGRTVGRSRSSPLPIGSIKTNIGHLEPASGLAGVLKALLALNHGILPASLHFEEPNPHINFDDLNLTVCTQSLLLPNSANQYAGVNSFGFGGTNAHAVLAAGRKPASEIPQQDRVRSGAFAISADSRGALLELASDYAERVSQLSDEDTAVLSSAIVHRRERQSNRIVVSSTRSREVVRALGAFINGTEDPCLTTGSAIADEMPVAFVFAGNGCQWAGMGLSAYRSSAEFRARFEQVDGYFKQIGGWSLKDVLFSETLPERLPLTSVAQPLIFGIQTACTAALRASGLRPAAVLGHSVGEVAAAEAAGILDLRTAVKVIHFRSTHQELTHGAGRMAAVLGSAENVQDLAAQVPGIEIAAVNSPRAVTVAGSAEALARFKRLASERGVALLDLHLDYPFHTALMAPVEHHLRADLRDITPSDADVPFVSTVTGACLPGSRLDANYWWRNVREPVQFTAAVRAAAQLGARYFVEIGPRPTLLKHIIDGLQGEAPGIAAVATLDRTDDDVDPFQRVRAKAIISGARVDTDKVFGSDPGPEIKLPHYPWQQTPFRFKPTVEANGNEADRHPFAGARSAADGVIWRSHVDTKLYPELADHQLGDQIIFPGAGFLEIVLWVARQWLRTDNIIVSNLDILNPLDLTDGETREIMTRVSPGSNTLEILSRPRLSHASWLTHCRCKVQTGNAAATATAPSLRKAGRAFSDAEVYGIADASGLHYGPAFRLLRGAVTGDGGMVSVELVAAVKDAPFALDPIRLDAGAHGFFTVFPEVRAIERGVTYIPVRFEEVALYRPNVAPARVLIEITTKNERSIVANCYVFDANDQIIAVLRGVRSQAVVTRRASSLETIAFVEHPHSIDGCILGQTGIGATAEDIVADADALGVIVSETSSSEPEMLLEGWATAVAYELASGLAENNILDVDMLVARGRIPESQRSWFLNLLFALEAANLVKREHSVWTMISDLALPSSTSVVKALVTERQSRAAEALLAAAISGFAKQVVSNPDINWSDSIISKSALDFYHTTSVEIREASDVLHRLLQENKRVWPKNRSLRILQVGYGHLATSLLSTQRDILLTIFEPDRRRYEGAELALSKSRNISLVDVEHVHELGTYDLIIGVSALHRLPINFSLVDLKRLLAPGGLLIMVEPGLSLFKDLVFGLDPNWFLNGSPDRPASPLRPIKSWLSKIGAAGFSNAQASLLRSGSDLPYLIVAEAGSAVDGIIPTPELAPAAKVLLIAPTNEPSLVDKLKTGLAEGRLDVSAIASLSDYPALSPDAVVLLPEFSPGRVDSVPALARRCLDIKACAERIGNVPARLWLVFSGALMSGSGSVHPVETGAWAFSRTLANEYPKLDVRRIDIAPNLSSDLAAQYIQKILVADTDETELQVDELSVRAVRVESLGRVFEAKASTGRGGARLERRSTSGERLFWQPVDRKPPDAGEVEIEVDAAGLNFRDLMWSLSLLPEDMLEDGFSGATLGLECAGRIARVGPGVKDVKVGDRVMAFAASSFATYITVESGQAVKLPEKISVEAAATIPVAFFTAYYSLVTQAKLSRREWVLIHGGAGAVGMAAIQIAQSRGARVIATAGSPAKRELLRSLGVRYLLDSRSTSFVDEVRRITGGGVDVVLNSLAGEAMERSIGCLRPFGRFVELGKRDYVTNTHIGLRPFRKNLSYFGVDVDQVIGARRSESDKIFLKIVQQFEKGTFVPLPYSVFDANNVFEAFHLMQQSSHVGKIVVRPPKELPCRVTVPFRVSRDQTHIITGAFGGFGMETAKWLVEKGARYLVMIGRRGAAEPEAHALIKDFTSRGIKVIANPCDVTDRDALEELFGVIQSTMPPIAGIMHEAMVLDDAILANLDVERFERVLAPKVAGVDNLDYLVHGMKLDYFVLFSSVTTLIGNPGQGNYVAANAYMEGVARRRRQKGLPALAIGWGPITDVGVVARNERLQSGLKKLNGVMGLSSREAFELMAQALEQSSDSPDTAVMTIAPHEGSSGAERLAVLQSPTYASYLRRSARSRDNDVASIDLRELAASEGIEAARGKVASVIVSQLAHVLHLREEDINQARPLGEIGLDSLMALELVMNLEECFGIHIPLSGSSGGMTVSGIADEIMAHVGLDQDEAVVGKLVEQHHSEIGTAQLETLKGMMAEEVHAPKRLLS